MEKELLCFVSLSIILGIHKLQSTHCALIDVNLECTSSSDICSVNGQIAETSKVLAITASSCETCTLKVNTTRGHQICLEIESISSWSQLDHFYFVNADVITGFTEKSEKCSITFRSNAVEICYKMNASFVIRTQVMNQSEERSESAATTCKLSHNCKNLLNFHDLKYVTYREQKSSFESAAYSYFRSFPIPASSLFGEINIKGELPPCPSSCMCDLLYQQL